MAQYHITYYYLATGMEGRPDIQDYGIVNASSPDEAKRKAARRYHPDMAAQDLDWVIGCLSARLAAS